MELIHVEEQKEWLALNDEVQIGKLVYKIEDGFLIITHTEVEPYYRGNKIAEDLVLATIDQAQNQTLKIKPECSFAAIVFDRYPEHAELLAGN
ncbi:GNAT family N-acetyltransferase [Sphingobacterium sp. UT-1RO-CII-1]|uniref:GNAT family N-acetyltransferase n=1 Tax=Sphingobacterium sp. UT-1RO-CII-1 TaxID=2995225 RepID=UPI00227A1B11|nr:GNAT family N-acetyltransferase [Sphingobacterium sp. UT-1RO-CII-1]MCY4779433.1 GNAT family N-acetyltransferase [Sphingobacterium sp. UT-1RO-CII-1]